MEVSRGCARPGSSSRWSAEVGKLEAVGGGRERGRDTVAVTAPSYCLMVIALGRVMVVVAKQVLGQGRSQVLQLGCMRRKVDG